MLAEVTGFDLDRREVVLDHLPNGDGPATLGYDTLIVAGGSRYSYFGHDEWQTHAPELKSLAGALEIRSRILAAFEAAEVEPDPERRQSWLTFVVVGAGPTGVEMAGQIAELAHDALRRDFRSVDTQTARVLLVEAADRVLASFPESLSRKAARALEQLGVTPLAGHTVVDVDADSVAIRDPRRRGRAGRAHARRSGPPASPPPTSPPKLAGEAGLDVDRAGRVTVGPDLTAPRPPGGVRARRHGAGAGRRRHDRAAPGPRPGRDAAGPLRRARDPHAACAAGRRAPFRYVDKGNLATIGRSKAVADVKGVRLAGLPRLGALAPRPPLLPDRLPEPAARPRSAGRSASSPADGVPG